MNRACLTVHFIFYVSILTMFNSLNYYQVVVVVVLIINLLLLLLPHINMFHAVSQNNPHLLEQ